MDMRKCDVCGESYSTTYRRCPFCEEEEALQRGKPVRRRAKDFRSRRGGHAVGVLVLLAVFVAAGLFAGRFFGDKIANIAGIREPPPVVDDDPVQTNPSPDGDDPTDHTDPPPTTDEPPEDPTPETPVALSSADFTLGKPGDTEQLTVSGGGGSYTWKSDNAAVATVTPEGLVTATGSGNANVSVTDGYTTAVCIVRVRGQQDTAGTVRLNRDDMTMPPGTTFQLKVSGTSSPVTWSIADTSIATISGDGTVSFIKKGKTTVTASVDGKTLTCIVRVS